MHKAKAIIDGYINVLTAASITAYQSRVRPVDIADTPCVFINIGSEERSYEMSFVECQLDIELILKIATKENNIDAELLLLRGKVEDQIQASNEFNIDYVTDVKLTDVSAPEITIDGDMPVATSTLNYRVNYRYQPNNPLI